MVLPLNLDCSHSSLINYHNVMISKLWYVDPCIYHMESHCIKNFTVWSMIMFLPSALPFAVAILAIHRKTSFFIISLKPKSSPLNPIIELLEILTSNDSGHSPPKAIWLSNVPPNISCCFGSFLKKNPHFWESSKALLHSNWLDLHEASKEYTDHLLLHYAFV